MKIHIPYFTPGQMKSEHLENLFVVREHIAERIYKGIKDSAYNNNHHNFLLFGPNGIGKTHLISLIHHRILADKKLKGRLIISRLGENLYFAGYNNFLFIIIEAIAEREKLDDIIQRMDSILDISMNFF